MKTLEVKVTRVGNGRGVRLPASTMRRCKIGETLLLEEHPNAIVLRPQPAAKLSWDATAKAMAAAKEDWSEWDCTVADGLHEL